MPEGPRINQVSASFPACLRCSYYVQVEQKRLGIPRETPCAVQQW
jgi:hypothetical protein